MNIDDHGIKFSRRTSKDNGGCRMKKFGFAVSMIFLVASISSCSPTPVDTVTTTVTSNSPSTTPHSTFKKIKHKKKITVAQDQAIISAQAYIDTLDFSRAGLIEQLTNSYGDGFKKADALYAANHITVDWNAEAVESAKSYLQMGGFSRASLIQQLHSKAGEGFTLKQATYAANKVGL